MEGYLGEEDLVSLTGTPYKGYSKTDWAILFIQKCGHVEGSDHKAWVLDQVIRILKDTPVIVSVAKWAGGLQEYRFRTGSPSISYTEWVASILGEANSDGEYEYDYDEGIAP